MSGIASEVSGNLAHVRAALGDRDRIDREIGAGGVATTDLAEDLKHRRKVAIKVLHALEYAHGHGVVHRDMKPEDILLQNGHALVADFGIALAVHHAGGARMTHHLSRRTGAEERRLSPRHPEPGCADEGRRACGEVTNVR